MKHRASKLHYLQCFDAAAHFMNAWIICRQHEKASPYENQVKGLAACQSQTASPPGLLILILVQLEDASFRERLPLIGTIA